MSPLRFTPLAGLLAFAVHGQLDAQATGSWGNGSATGRPDASAEEAFFQKYPDALLYKGLFLFEAGRHLEAAHTWERYLAVAPEGTDTAAIIVIIEEAFGREYPEWLLYRGLGLFESRDFRGAERVWSRYLQLAPEDPDRDSVRRLVAEARARQTPAGS